MASPRGVLAYTCAGLSTLCCAAPALLQAPHALLPVGIALGVIGLIAATTSLGRLVNGSLGVAAAGLLVIHTVRDSRTAGPLYEDASLRGPRDAPAPGGQAVEAYDAAVLLRKWQADREATDARLAGKLVAITGLPGAMPSYDPAGARYVFFYSDPSARFYISAAAGQGPVVCLYRGTVHDKFMAAGEQHLHLEGCR